MPAPAARPDTAARDLPETPSVAAGLAAWQLRHKAHPMTCPSACGPLEFRDLDQDREGVAATCRSCGHVEVHLPGSWQFSRGLDGPIEFPCWLCRDARRPALVSAR